MEINDLFSFIVIIHLVIFSLVYRDMQLNKPDTLKSIGGDTALLGFLGTLQFLSYFMTLSFLSKNERPKKTRRLIIYILLFASSWAVFTMVIGSLIDML